MGKKPIGFLNPSLYANPSMLNDITNGKYIRCYEVSKVVSNDNLKIGTNVGCNTTGFAAVPG